MTIAHRIDTALDTLGELKGGLPEYTKLAAAAWSGPGTPEERLDRFRQGVVELAGRAYRASTGASPDLVSFHDRGCDYLFDVRYSRTVLVHGLTVAAPPRSRDASYHAGYPARAGYDKGHAFGHAQGGREGGPNYFPQAARVNRRLSAVGNVWRDLETWLARHPGTYAFVRLIYPRGSRTDVPDSVEYGLITGPRQFRSVVFPNR